MISSLLKCLMLVVISLSVLTETAAGAEELPNDCYDVIVSAKIVSQVPSVIPDCDDCIVITWPWFVDLAISRVVEGRVSERKITVLALMHVPYRDNLGVRKWWLRRNADGGFNLLRFDMRSPPSRCLADAGAQPAHLRPSDGKTLADLRREGEDAYSHRAAAER